MITHSISDAYASAPAIEKRIIAIRSFWNITNPKYNANIFKPVLKN